MYLKSQIFLFLISPTNALLVNQRQDMLQAEAGTGRGPRGADLLLHRVAGGQVRFESIPGRWAEGFLDDQLDVDVFWKQVTVSIYLLIFPSSP